MITFYFWVSGQLRGNNNLLTGSNPGMRFMVGFRCLVGLVGHLTQKLRVPTPRSELYLGPPVVPFYPFLGKGSPTKIDYRKKGYPYSTLSTGGPSYGFVSWICGLEAFWLTQVGFSELENHHKLKCLQRGQQQPRSMSLNLPVARHVCLSLMMDCFHHVTSRPLSQT